MKVVILLGSVRTGRQSHHVAHYLQKTLTQQGIETDLIDLNNDPLPIYRASADDEPQLLKRIEHIGNHLNQGDALLLVTPEYHGSFSGALKNTLDYFGQEFQKKAIGIVTTSAGKFGGINAATQLQHVVLSLGGIALPSKLLVAEVHRAFDSKSNPLDAQVRERTHQFLDKFLWLADALHRKTIQDKAFANSSSICSITNEIKTSVSYILAVLNLA